MASDQNTSKLKTTMERDSDDIHSRCSPSKYMKKDDSGIQEDKEDLSSGSSEDDLNSVTANSLPEKSPVVATAEKSDQGSPDSGNPEAINSSDETQIPVADVLKKHSTDETSVADETSVNEERDIDEEIKHALEAENDAKYDPTPKTDRPKYKWNVTLATLQRQYGMSIQCSPDLFRYKCYGSMHMAERLELMYKMKGHGGCVNSLHFNTNGTKLVSSSDDLGVIIWDWPTSEIILEFASGHRSNVFQAKFMPLCGDSQIVTCARDGQIRAAELSACGTCSQTRKLAQHRGAAHKLAIQSDSSHTFLSCGEDAVVYEIDLRESKPEKLAICKENGKKVPLYSIFINPNKSYEYIVGGRDEYVRVYDKRFPVDSGGLLKKYCPFETLPGNDKTNVTAVVYNYNGTEILVSYNDDDIYLFDSYENNTSKFLHRYVGHRNSQTVKGVNFFGSKSEYIISGSDCGHIFFWDKESEHIIKYMHGDEAGVVNCLEPNPNMPVLASSGLDDDIKIWVPSAEEPPNLSKLRKHIIYNMKEREDDKQNEAEVFDDQVLWFLMQHLRRSGRRSQSAERGNESSDDSSSEDSVDEDYDQFNQRRSNIQCNQS